MTFDRTRRTCYDRGIESIQSGLLLFGFAILLSLFMAAVIFLNGSG